MYISYKQRHWQQQTKLNTHNSAANVVVLMIKMTEIQQKELIKQEPRLINDSYFQYQV